MFLRRRTKNGEQSFDRARSIVEVPVDRIMPNPDQPRKSFDEAGIAELAASIAQVGLIQPLIVRRKGNRYELIAGERRLRAAKLLGLRNVNCIVESRPDEDSALMAIVENLQREDLHFFEEAECYSALIHKHGLTQEELAMSLGKSQSFIANKLRLLRIGPAVRNAIISANLTERHARALLKLPDDDIRITAVERIRRSSLAVKETERLVERLIAESQAQSEKPHKPRIIRIFKDYRAFINTVNAACDQLRESGLNVVVMQNDLENGVDIVIKVTQCS